MNFRLDLNPPAVTAQQKGVRIIKRGRQSIPMFYDKPEVKRAKALFAKLLLPHRPMEPLAGPLCCRITWTWPYRKSEPKKNRTSWLPCYVRPDCDNLAKILLDCMSDAGFWNDDGQVAELVFRKGWGERPGIEVSVTAATSPQPQAPISSCGSAGA